MKTNTNRSKRNGSWAAAVLVLATLASPVPAFAGGAVQDKLTATNRDRPVIAITFAVQPSLIDQTIDRLSGVMPYLLWVQRLSVRPTMRPSLRAFWIPSLDGQIRENRRYHLLQPAGAAQ